MKKNFWIIGLLTLALAGCNAGMAPEPMSEDQLKSTLDKLPAKDQIAYIKSTPMTSEQKAQRIKEIEEKTGYKDPGSATMPTAPRTGP